MNTVMAAFRNYNKFRVAVQQMPERLLVCWLAMLFVACDPVPHEELYPSQTATIIGKLNSKTGAIPLGDTLSLYLEIPDTLNTNPGQVVITSLQRAEVFIDVHLIDTVGNRGLLLKPPLYWTSLGQISPSNSTAFIFSSATKPYQLKIHFKAAARGLYFFGVSSQRGKIKANNGFVANLIVNFDLPSRYTELAEPYLGTDWANGIRFRDAGGYVFRVY
jgi:hypothetical protein